MNRKQRARQHMARTRHAQTNRSPQGEGTQASVPPGARQMTVGKVMPARRRLESVHDMAAAARGRDDVERAWRRAFKGVHSLGQSGHGPMSRTAVQMIGRQTPTAPNESPSGARKRRHRGHTQSALQSRAIEHLKLRMVESIGQRRALMVMGWTEIAPGHWRRLEDTDG